MLPVAGAVAAAASFRALGVAMMSAPEAREKLEAAGLTPEQAGAEWAAAMGRDLLRQLAPTLAIGAAALAAGVLLVLRRRAGRWVALGVATWLVGGFVVEHVRARLAPPMKLAFLPELRSTTFLQVRPFGLELPPVDAAVVDAVVLWGWVAAVVGVVGVGVWSERRARGRQSPAE